MKKTKPTVEQFVEAQNSAEFTELRSKFRGFTFPVTIIAFIWFVVYLLTAVYAPSFMATKLLGNINVGVLFGTLQFVSTFAITFAYVKFANREIEPRTEALRAEIDYAAENHTTIAEARAQLAGK